MRFEDWIEDLFGPKGFGFKAPIVPSRSVASAFDPNHSKTYSNTRHRPFKRRTMDPLGLWSAQYSAKFSNQKGFVCTSYR